MPEGYGASHGIPALDIDLFACLLLQLLDDRNVLRRKGFIALDDVEIRKLETCALQSNRDGISGCNTHNGGIDAVVRAADPSGHRFETQLLCFSVGHQKDESGPVINTGGISRRDGPIFFESGLEFRKFLKRFQTRMPAGSAGPAFLVTHNFDVVYSYNAAESYSLAACVLADRLAGGSGIVTPWPTDDPGLSRAGRRELQALLIKRGYDVGQPDGAIGNKTKEAIADFEGKNGLPVNGRASAKVLEALRR